MNSTPLGKVGGTILFLQLASAPAQSATCLDLAALKLPKTTITFARTVNAGAFVRPPDSPRADSSFFTAFETLAAFCRVQGIIRPAADSRIEFEVWLPISAWSGRYIGAGNGGFSGSINYYRLAEAIRDGSVGSATDVGHKDDELRWWVGHPEKVIDFEYRAIHETSRQAKAIIKAFYGTPQLHAYFISCSNGGRQGIVEAQQYPADYDGILAGAPAYAFGANLGRARRPRSLHRRAPDLEAFRSRGGKLIIYHGGSDGPAASIDVYRDLLSIMGRASVDDFMRLYVVPGMGHCGVGTGPEPADIGERLRPSQDSARSVSRALQRWVERGVAPREIIATKYRTEDDPTSGIIRTRPVCPYPHEAHWSGKGDPDDAATYVCEPPARN